MLAWALGAGEDTHSGAGSARSIPGMTHDWVTFLQKLVNENQRFEGLYLVGEDWLGSETIPDGQTRMVVPGIHDTLWVVSYDSDDCDDSLRTCFCSACQLRPRGISLLGAVSSALVAFLMFKLSSDSVLSRSTGRVG